MASRTIHLTEFDLKRLKQLLAEAGQFEYRGSTYLENLEAELGRATVVPSKQVPADVVTMNTRARMRDMDTGEEMVYTLVFPDDADVREGKISVLAPFGTAMLGYRVGDIFEWEAPAGIRRIKVEEVLYQPEASGDFDL